VGRWHGPGRNTTKGYRWRKESCEYCGFKYKNLRIADYFPDVGYTLSQVWDNCKAELRREREAAELAGDYSQPVNRRSVLGRMHEYKQDAWRQHTRVCAEQAALSETQEDDDGCPF
jgi:hypothetical protein